MLCSSGPGQNADKNTGFHRRYCWIKFSTPEGVQNVLQKDSHILEGAKVSKGKEMTLRQSQCISLWYQETAYTII
nr:PREDICTED: SRA stem-loop-interacting RNA-binding protein, mitochondrial [Opisthocomus hoazin]